MAQTVAWGLRPLWFFEGCRRRFGHTFTIRFYDGRPIVVVSHPADLKAIFALTGDEMDVGSESADILEPFLGPMSLLVLDGDDHRQERRRLQHAFRAERLETYRALVAEVTRRELATWPASIPFALHPRMRRITLDVILRAVFGAKSDHLVRLRAALEAFLADSSGSLFVLIPPFRRDLGGYSPWAHFVRQRDAVRREVLKLIGQRRGDRLEDRTDMLSALLQGGEPTDQQVLDELMTFVLAGHDTTATALAWAFDLLTHYPAVLERLRASLAAGSDDYLEAVVFETLRIRPVIAEVARKLRRPLTLVAGEFPAGTTVMASIHLAHTDHDRYADPRSFRPERFLDHPPDIATTWLPFGGGVRRCLGAGFATLELQEVIRTVVNHTALRATHAGLDRPKRRAVTLIPRHGCRVIAHKLRVESVQGRP